MDVKVFIISIPSIRNAVLFTKYTFLNQIVSYISCNLSAEPADTATVNYGTYFPNEPSDPYVGTFDGTSEGVVISGSEGYESPEPFKGIDIP